MRKIIILLVVLVSGMVGLSYLYFSKLNTENTKNDTALQLATNHASLVFSFQNDKSFYQIIDSQQLLQQVLGQEKTSLLLNFRKEIIDNPLYNSFINDQPLYLSLMPDEKNDINFLFTAQISNVKEITQLKNKLSNKAKSNNEILTVKFNDSLNVFFGFKHNVVTASTSLKLVQNAIQIQNNTAFIDYIKNNNQNKKNVLATVYLNFNEAPALLKNILSGNLTGELSFLNKQNSFAVLNYNFGKEKILFNGNTDLKSADNYLKLFENIAPQTISITNILPNNVANYTVYAYDDYTNWHNKLESWFIDQNEKNKTEQIINNIQSRYRVNLDAILPVYTKNQFVTFQLSTGEKLGAISLSNGEKVKQLLLDISENYSEEVNAFKAEGILYSYFGEPFKKFKRPFYTIVDNYLITANNASTVQVFLNSYKNSKLLIQSNEYNDALNQVSNTANISFYVNLKNSDVLLRNNLKTELYREFRKEDGLKTFDTFYYQMSADKNKFMTNVLLNKFVTPVIPDTVTNR